MAQATKAVIFDMDGTLVDTEAVAPELEKILLEDLGIRYTKNFRQEIISLTRDELYKLIKEKYKPDFSVEKAEIAYKEYARTLYEERASLMPGTRELLSFLQKKNVPIAIASTSPREWIDMFVKRFGFEDMFQHLLSVESMNFPSKPDPAIFSEAIRLLNVQPQEAVVFEDTVRGVEAGKGAGARVIAVPDERWSHGDFSQADLIVDTLKDPRILPFLGLAY